MPKISVLMSIYKEPVEWMRQSIDSILNQTYTDFEFIIVNDNPEREENSQLLNEYAQKDKRIKVITNEQNIGLTKSLNKGLQIAKGEYIARMDADDISVPNRIAEQVKFMEANPDIIASGGCAIGINEKGEAFTKVKVPTESGILRIHSLFASPILHPASIFRETYNGVSISYDESFKYAQDYALWVSLLKKGYRLGNLDKFIIQYRYSENQIFKKHKEEQNECAKRINQAAIDAIGLELSHDDNIVWESLKRYQAISKKDVSHFYDTILKIYEENQNMPIIDLNQIINQLAVNLYVQSEISIFQKVSGYLHLCARTKQFCFKSIVVILLSAF